MLYVELTMGVAGLIAFLFLRPRVKVLIAFFIMTSCFDLAPNIIFNRSLWDVGAVLLMIAWCQLAFSEAENSFPSPRYVTLIRIYIGWMFLCLAWSILIYQYPVLNTLKASRQMVIGFLSFFVFRRLFIVDQSAFEFLMKSSYVATFVLLPIVLLQHFLGKPLLFGLQREYGDVIRSLPIFLPIVLMHFWIIASRALAAEKLAKHEVLYAGMAIGVTVFTYTRGIYATVLLIFGVLLLTLAYDRRLNVERSVGYFVLAVFCVTVLAIGGYADRVTERFASGVDLLLMQKSQANERNQDTYTGRLALAKERFEMVARHNPIIGYGFIHEENVPEALRNKLQYGSVVNTPEYKELYAYGHSYVLALHSADIGWADIIINTGIFGLTLWLLFFILFVWNYYRTARLTDEQYYHVRLAFLLQTMVGALLMFESHTFVSHVEIAMFMLAGCWYCAYAQPESHTHSDDFPTVVAEMAQHEEASNCVLPAGAREEACET